MMQALINFRRDGALIDNILLSSYCDGPERVYKKDELIDPQ